MSEPAISFEGVDKKFHRTLSSALRCGARDGLRGLLRLKPVERLGRDEFWALHEISFAARPGECVGVIGPNGAGKSTLLKLVNRDYRPDRGRILTRGRVKSLIRLGTGLQPLLTGRENVYVKCTELGLGKRDIDGMLEAIAAFAGLEASLDKPVRQYSDGMYARLEFSIATCVPMDILLIDEVLAVGDIAFQMRALERLDQLKRAGTTLLFVSHSEMNVRRIADRCLLLFDGEALAFGDTDALFRKYYDTVGFLSRRLEPLGAAPEVPEDFAGVASITRLDAVGREETGRPRASTGRPLALTLGYAAGRPVTGVSLVLEFWNSAGLLMGSFDSGLNGAPLALAAPSGALRVELPFLALTAGIYRIAGGFRAEGRWLGYGSNLLSLAVVQQGPEDCRGLVALSGRVEAEEPRAGGSAAGR